MGSFNWSLITGVFALAGLVGACSASSDSDDGNNGGSAGSSSATGGQSGGSGSNVCTAAEVSVVQSCVPLYEQQAYPTCSAIAACAKNEARSSITDGCYFCLADVASTCDVSGGTVACPCCVP